MFVIPVQTGIHLAFIIILLPLILSIVLIVIWGLYKEVVIPWQEAIIYCVYLAALVGCFLGIAFLLSVVSKTTEMGLSLAFFIWLIFLLFLDMLLLAMMVKSGFDSEQIVLIALFNPLQVFRTASMLMFDPQLVLLGPAAYVLLDFFGPTYYMIWASIYPFILGLFFAILGFYIFKRSDLV